MSTCEVEAGVACDSSRLDRDGEEYVSLGVIQGRVVPEVLEYGSSGKNNSS